MTTTKPPSALTLILKVPVVKYPETSKSGRLITTKEFRQQREGKKEAGRRAKDFEKAEREKKGQTEKLYS